MEQFGQRLNKYMEQFSQRLNKYLEPKQLPDNYFSPARMQHNIVTMEELLLLEKLNLLDVLLKDAIYTFTPFEHIGRCAHILQNYFPYRINNVNYYNGPLIHCGELRNSGHREFVNIAPIEISWYILNYGRFNESRIKFLTVISADDIELFKTNNGNYPLVITYPDTTMLAKVLMVDTGNELHINAHHHLYNERLNHINYNDWKANKYQILHGIIGDVLPPRISSVKRAI